MSNKRSPKIQPLGTQIHQAVENYLASSTRPVMEDTPQSQGEIMSDINPPVTVITDTNPDIPEDTVVTARFNRKKIAKIAGAATAAVGVILVAFGAGKTAGRDEFIDDVHRAVRDDDEPTES